MVLSILGLPCIETSPGAVRFVHRREAALLQLLYSYQSTDS